MTVAVSYLKNPTYSSPSTRILAVETQSCVLIPGTIALPSILNRSPFGCVDTPAPGPVSMSVKHHATTSAACMKTHSSDILSLCNILSLFIKLKWAPAVCASTCIQEQFGDRAEDSAHQLSLQKMTSLQKKKTLLYKQTITLGWRLTYSSFWRN